MRHHPVVAFKLWISRARKRPSILMRVIDDGIGKDCVWKWGGRGDNCAVDLMKNGVTLLVNISYFEVHICSATVLESHTNSICFAGRFSAEMT